MKWMSSRPGKPLPKLPVARAVWQCRPDLPTAAAPRGFMPGARITPASARRSQPRCWRTLRKYAGVELVIIDAQYPAARIQEGIAPTKFITRWPADSAPDLTMSGKYTVGLDYGTNSVRALVVDTADGREVATAVWNYAHGDSAALFSRAIPTWPASIPAITSKGRKSRSKGAGGREEKDARVQAGAGRRHWRGHDGQHAVAGGWTRPAAGVPDRRFAKNPAAMAWLWKDHTGVAEAAEITALAEKIRPQYLAKCGGTYSSEWFFSKILHCLRTTPEVFDAAAFLGGTGRLCSRR
jgi:hypothetical protein